MIDHPALGPADADPQPRNDPRAKVFNDRGEAVMATGRAIRPKAKLTERKGHVVEDHEHLRGFDLVELTERAHRLAAEVHVGQRLAEEQIAGAGHFGLPAFLHAEIDAFARGELVEKHEANIVTRVS